LYAEQLSNLGALPSGVTVSNLSQVPSEAANVLRDHLATQANHHDEIFTALNTAVLGDGAFVYIPAGKAVETPIHLLFLSTGQGTNSVSHPRVLIVAGKGAIATVVETYAALDENVYFTNAVAEVFTAQDAVVTHYRLQQESEQAFHIATTQVRQERGSNYSSYAISLGGQLARHDLNVELNDEHIETTIDGLYVVTGKQHVDNHTTIDHAHPHCTSHQVYKGILDDKGARSLTARSSCGQARC
jgi:Fe-S cluster assembly protein SufD